MKLKDQTARLDRRIVLRQGLSFLETADIEDEDPSQIAIIQARTRDVEFSIGIQLPDVREMSSWILAAVAESWSW